MTRRAPSAAPKKDEATGTWRFVVDLGQGADGKRRQATRRGFPTKKAAQEELDKLRRSVTTATYVPPKRQTLGDYLTADWLPAVRRELAASTWESYDRNIRVHVVPRIGGVQLQQVDGALLTRFYGDLLDSGRKRGNQSPGLKARTVRYMHTILSGAFDDAVRWQRLIVNPATRATPPSAGESKAPEMRTWTGPQVRTFLDLCEGDRYAPAFAFLALTGCRRGECLGLRWSDVDLPAGTAAIRQSVIPLTKASGKGREGRIVARTKTDRARVIELDAATVATLRKWRRYRRPRSSLWTRATRTTG
jgi:integrase